MSTISGHTTRAVGTVLTAAIYNFDHVNHVNNANALNADKMEGATPPVVDGQMVVWDGTGGNAVRSGGFTPAGPGQTDLAIADGGTGQGTAIAAFQALKAGSDATETVNGVIEHATIAEIRAATIGNFAVTAAKLESAAALVQLTDAATIAVDWDAFINAYVDLTANRILGNPTNGQIGTWRTIMVRATDATLRTLTFASQYAGDVPTLTNITNARNYLLTIYCFQTSHFVVSAKRAAGTA